MRFLSCCLFLMAVLWSGRVVAAQAVVQVNGIECVQAFLYDPPSFFTYSEYGVVNTGTYGVQVICPLTRASNETNFFTPSFSSIYVYPSFITSSLQCQVIWQTRADLAWNVSGVTFSPDTGSFTGPRIKSNGTIPAPFDSAGESLFCMLNPGQGLLGIVMTQSIPDTTGAGTLSPVNPYPTW